MQRGKKHLIKHLFYWHTPLHSVQSDAYSHMSMHATEARATTCSLRYTGRSYKVAVSTLNKSDLGRLWSRWQHDTVYTSSCGHCMARRPFCDHTAGTQLQRERQSKICTPCHHRCTPTMQTGPHYCCVSTTTNHIVNDNSRDILN